MCSSWYGSDDVVSNCKPQAYGESLTADMMLTHVNILALLYTRITISKMSGRLDERRRPLGIETVEIWGMCWSPRKDRCGD
jgi:hypothetical protein